MRRFGVVVLVFLLAGCEGRALRLNEIQVLGSHNSYKQPMDAGLLAELRQRDPDAGNALDYGHLPLERQLELGLRKLELDVYHDPEGGRYATPSGIRSVEQATPFDPRGVMRSRGFKVLHVQDLDFRSHCLTLAECLAILREWSERHPRHVPIAITVNAKDDPVREDFVVPLPFDAAAFDQLDAAFRAGLGERLLTPDDVRATGHAETVEPSLETVVLQRGWPALDVVRGRFMVILDESPEKLATYVAGHPALAGRVMFANVPEGRPESAVRIVNDPVEQFDYIVSLVERGYLVRTRADADTREARSGDTRRRDAAFASGAQLISTDYYVPDSTLGSGYRVTLPGGGVARCNPVLVREPCTIAE